MQSLYLAISLKQRGWIPIFALLTFSILLRPMQAQGWRMTEWHPLCVRRPAEISSSNKASIKREDCLISHVDSRLQGRNGLLWIYRFRDGAPIRIFKPECSLMPMGPCPIAFSINSASWAEGVYELPNSLMHTCGAYRCNWETHRDARGTLVLAVAMSY